MELFTGESLLSQADNGEITLTTHRIWQKGSEGNKSYKTSIMLEHVTSCEASEESNFKILSLGIVLLFFALAIQEPLLAGIGVLAFIAYFLTKRSYICIKSPTAKIEFNTSGMNTKSIDSVINKIEKAKHERLVKLNKG